MNDQFIQNLIFDLDDVLQDLSFDLGEDTVPYQKLKTAIQSLEEYLEDQ